MFPTCPKNVDADTSTASPILSIRWMDANTWNGLQAVHHSPDTGMNQSSRGLLRVDAFDLCSIPLSSSSWGRVSVRLRLMGK